MFCRIFCTACRYGEDEDFYFSEGEDLIKAFWSDDEGEPCFEG